jgi:hypothetical protein
MLCSGIQISSKLLRSVFGSLTKRIVYFKFQTTQQFIKSIQMAYLHEGRISEAQHVSIPNESSSGVEFISDMDPYCAVVLCFDIELVTRSSKLNLKLIKTIIVNY